MADRSITYPRGIVENVLVKVDKFIFPVDLVVLDMEEDLNIPLIPGRSFLATGAAMIDVQNGELTLWVNNKKFTFSIAEAMKQHDTIDEDCFQILTIQETNSETYLVSKREYYLGDKVLLFSSRLRLFLGKLK